MRQARILRGILSRFNPPAGSICIGIQRILSQTGRSSMPGEQNLQVGCRVRSLRISRGFAISRHGCNPPARLLGPQGRSRSGQSGFKVSITILPTSPAFPQPSRSIVYAKGTDFATGKFQGQETTADRWQPVFPQPSRTPIAVSGTIWAGREASEHRDDGRQVAARPGPTWTSCRLCQGERLRDRDLDAARDRADRSLEPPLSSLVALPCPHRAWWPTRFGSCPI